MDVGALVNGQYTIIEHIGRGGMADVWSARDIRLRRMVAIKTIVSGLSKDIDPVELFKREAHTIAQMEHPHILPIYDFGEYEHNLYIVMRYVTGGSLEDMLREGPMTPEDVLRMGDAIAEALDYAHSNNVIHLDLKPPNILLDSSGSPYLADFGLATVLDPEGRARNPGSGTLLYMAPEQMLSDMIDHRADIYSFCIMLYHMLTGSLPFDGNIPLSMSQVQRDMGLPSLEDHVTYLPHDLTELLRLGTNLEPRFRPESHMEIMEQFRDLLQPSGISLNAASFDGDYNIEADPHNLLTEPYGGDIHDADLLEAIDIYTRARYDWQGGQGRFLLGVTNFILMSDYYQNAAMHGLSIDKAGYQVLLRGAIEYDYEINYWWHQIGDDDRRWVCLHALRSGNTPARIRALYRLETLPDEEGTAVIPRLVAQALEVESDDNAKLAALKVLGTRVRLMKKRPTMKIMTEYRGRLISSMTRLGIELTPPTEWQQAVYSEDVDVLIAEQAFDSSPVVAESAARTVGRIRSIAAIEHLSREQKNKRSGALEALALVRDEAPSLPDLVSREARFYAWITNTVRRLTENPVELIAKIALVFIMGWIAMGDHVWSTYRITVGSLGPARWTNTVALGVIFGLLMSVIYVFAVLISQRLQGFWSWWLRLLVSGILGFGIAMMSFASYRYLVLQQASFEIAWDQMRFAGAALTFGLLATNLLRLRAWQGVILTSITTFTPLYLAHRAFYYRQESTIVFAALLAILIGLFSGWRIAQLTKFKLDLPFIKVPIVSLIMGILLGLLWTAAMWGFYLYYLVGLVGTEVFTWDTVLMIASVNILLGLIASYWFNNTGRIGLGIAATIAFIGVYAFVSWQFFDYSFSLPFVNPSFDVMYAEGTALLPFTDAPIIDYDRSTLNDIFALGLPWVIVTALGMNLSELLSGWWQWIGESRTPKERGAWMTATLGYVMIVTALISILTLFSPEINRLWELSWSFWAFITFILAMASFRWAKWGANGLLISGLLLLPASIVLDGVTMYQQANNGIFPLLLSPIPELSAALQGFGIPVAINEYHFWGVWAAMLAIFIWGAQRRLLWGGIGLVTMLVAWFLVVFTTSIQGSVAIFAITNVSLVFYILQGRYELMEVSRLNLPWRAATAQSTRAGTPDTVVNLHDFPLPNAPATQIIVDSPVNARRMRNEIPDALQTREPSLNDMRLMETVDFEKIPKPEFDPYEMDTVAPIRLNTEDLYTKFPRDSEYVDLEDTEEQASGLTDIKINLDTSALKAKEEVEEQASGLTDIKINLDTSALKSKANDSQTDAAPKPKFKFDSSQVVDQNTIKFDEEGDDEEDE